MRSALVLWALVAGALPSPMPTQVLAEEIESRGDPHQQGILRAMTEHQPRTEDEQRVKEVEKTAGLRGRFKELVEPQPFKREEDEEQRAKEVEKTARFRGRLEELVETLPSKRGEDEEQRAKEVEKTARFRGRFEELVEPLPSKRREDEEQRAKEVEKTAGLRGRFEGLVEPLPFKRGEGHDPRADKKADNPLEALRKLPASEKADIDVQSRAEPEITRKRPPQQRAKPIERTRGLRMRGKEEERQMLPDRTKPAEPRVQRQGLPDDRGVNWEQGTQGEFKFLVRLEVYFNNTKDMSSSPCGAALLGPKFIVTAAHCFDHQIQFEKTLKPDYTFGYFNDYRRDSSDESELLKASKIILHPDYNAATSAKDIAVVKLSKAVSYNEGTNEALENIPMNGSYIGGGVNVTIAGWGKESEDATSLASTMHHSTAETTLTNAECKNTAYSSQEILDDMLCAIGTTANGTVQDACQGDSGGPMFIRSGNTSQLVGIVSWGRGCADTNYPGVYTRISAFKTWVENTISANGG